MLELTIRDPNSLLSIVVRQDITDEQAEQIRQVLRTPEPEGLFVGPEAIRELENLGHE